jgi:hypothetical protein
MLDKFYVSQSHFKQLIIFLFLTRTSNQVLYLKVEKLHISSNSSNIISAPFERASAFRIGTMTVCELRLLSYIANCYKRKKGKEEKEVDAHIHWMPIAHT